MTLEALRAAVVSDWLTDALGQVAAEPASIHRLFPAVARECGRGDLAHGWRREDAARVVLLAGVPLTGAPLADLATELYQHGDAAEKRAVLLALPLLVIGDGGVPLLRDALRTNDTRLVSAALGPYAARLDQPAWRQAVLKCVFMGIPLSTVDRLGQRADPELARMLRGLADERAAAGRPFPSDAAALLTGKAA
jgi:hypothetical protein